LAAGVDHETGTETVVYQYQPGRGAEDDAFDRPPVDSETVLENLGAVIEGMRDIFQAHGIEPVGLGSDQFRATDEGGLCLTGAGSFRRFDPARPSHYHGEIWRYQDGDWSAGPDPRYAEPDTPGAAYVESNTIAVGRGSAPGNEASVFRAVIEDGRAVIITNPFTEESAMIHIRGADIGTDRGQAAITRAIQEMPSLGTEGAIAHVIGGENVGEDEVEGEGPAIVPRANNAWTNQLAAYLRLHGVWNIKTVPEDVGAVVRLDVNTGGIEVGDLVGNRAYQYQPLPPQITPPPPKAA
jgi:hypothetical protein